MIIIIYIQVKIDIILQNPNILIYSSLFFITNVITAFLNKYYLYSLLFCILTITSLIVHCNDNSFTNFIDKIAVSTIVLYGAYMLYNKINSNNYYSCLVIIVTFLYCIYFYIYGFLTKKFCFCEQISISQKYHFIMHIVASIGHHFIIFLY
jgi:hypothetical protein